MKTFVPTPVYMTKMNTLLRTLFIVMAACMSLTQRSLAIELPLTPGDQVGIQISGIPPEESTQINHLYRISEQGTISLLYLDSVQAAGLKPSQLEAKIVGLYKSKEIYTHPTVNVSIDSGSGTERLVYVSGAVTKPGPVPYRTGLTITKAISSAGGKTAFGRLSRVKLVRSGKAVGVFDLTKAGSAAGDTPLEPEDEIVVPD